DELLSQLEVAARRYLQARNATQQIRNDVLSANVSPDDLESVLGLYDPDPARTRARAAYNEALQLLLDAHPSRGDEIRRVASLNESYGQVKGPLDDPNDLIQL